MKNLNFVLANKLKKKIKRNFSFKEEIIGKYTKINIKIDKMERQY